MKRLFAGMAIGVVVGYFAARETAPSWTFHPVEEPGWVGGWMADQRSGTLYLVGASGDGLVQRRQIWPPVDITEPLPPYLQPER